MKFRTEKPIKKAYVIGPILMLIGILVVIASAVDYLFLNDNIPWWVTALAFLAVPVGVVLSMEISHIKEYDYNDVSKTKRN